MPAILEAIREGHEVGFEMVSRHGDSAKLIVSTRPVGTVTMQYGAAEVHGRDEPPELNPPA
jgi:hypothetical protein